MKPNKHRITRGLKWIGKKIAEKVFDAVWIGAGAVVLLGVFYGWISGEGERFINWSSESMDVSRWTLAAWFAGGVVTVGAISLFFAWRARRAFASIVIGDRKLPLQWRIKLEPTGWIDDDRMASHGHQYHESVLSGPFHAMSECGAMLKYEWPRYGALEDDGPLLMTHCPGCGAIVFDILEEDAYPPLYQVRLQAIEEIRRMARMGKRIKAGLELERPQYWQSMLPHPKTGASS